MYEQIAANKRKTFLLLAGAVAFTGLIGYAIGVYWGTGPAGLLIALAVAGVLSIGSYFGGDKLVLASTRAREVTPEEQPRLHNIVEGISIAAGLPKPRVYVVPESAPNAFATGRNPEHSSIAVTEGLGLAVEGTAALARPHGRSSGVLRAGGGLHEGRRGGGGAHARTLYTPRAPRAPADRASVPPSPGSLERPRCAPH